MSHTFISANWSYHGEDWRSQRDQLQDYIQALRSLHPLLEHFSEQGRKVGYGPMLKQPLVQDMTDAQWERVLRKDGSFKVLNFWNRHRQQNGRSVCIMPTYKVPGPRPSDLPFEGSSLAIRELPDSLLTEPVLTGILEATVTAFRPDHALIATSFSVPPTVDKSVLSQDDLMMAVTYSQDFSRGDRIEWKELLKSLKGGFDYPVWRFWLKHGKPWPKWGATVFERWQSEPADDEGSFLDGTLYTWKKYAPWKLPNESNWAR